MNGKYRLFWFSIVAIVNLFVTSVLYYKFPEFATMDKQPANLFFCLAGILISCSYIAFKFELPHKSIQYFLLSPFFWLLAASIVIAVELWPKLLNVFDSFSGKFVEILTIFLGAVFLIFIAPVVGAFAWIFTSFYVSGSLIVLNILLFWLLRPIARKANQIT